jgi:uroporphyrin-III C-methyltransferase/precorrin-2 dehydrogenase/sirohydrochlorin ferrochelatase
VFACTDRREVNASVAEEARCNHIWCNIADDPQSSDLHTVATCGAAKFASEFPPARPVPHLARHVKDEICHRHRRRIRSLLQIVDEARSGAEASLQGDTVA